MPHGQGVCLSTLLLKTIVYRPLRFRGEGYNLGAQNAAQRDGNDFSTTPKFASYCLSIFDVLITFLVLRSMTSAVPVLKL